MSFDKTNLRCNVLLKDYVTFKIGGPAELFFEAKTVEQLKDAVKFSNSRGIPHFLLGGGSNLVVSDKGVDGLVILNRVRETLKHDAEKNLIIVSSGYELSELVDFAISKSLSGMQQLSGIPGSVGGAIYGNAGAYGRAISDSLVSAQLLFPDGSIRNVDKDFFQFEYRTSRLKKDHLIVLSAIFNLEPGNIDQMIAEKQDILSQRESKHPDYDTGCAGSFFKNLPPLPGETRRRAAGAVLEKAGAKQMSYGGAKVYEKHANFIINEGKATASDVKQLSKLLKDKVLKDFGIKLHEEVMYIGKEF